MAQITVKVVGGSPDAFSELRNNVAGQRPPASNAARGSHVPQVVHNGDDVDCPGVKIGDGTDGSLRPDNLNGGNLIGSDGGDIDRRRRGGIDRQRRHHVDWKRRSDIDRT